MWMMRQTLAPEQAARRGVTGANLARLMARRGMVSEALETLAPDPQWLAWAQGARVGVGMSALLSGLTCEPIEVTTPRFRTHWDWRAALRFSAQVLEDAVCACRASRHGGDGLGAHGPGVVFGVAATARVIATGARPLHELDAWLPALLGLPRDSVRGLTLVSAMRALCCAGVSATFPGEVARYARMAMADAAGEASLLSIVGEPAQRQTLAACLGYRVLESTVTSTRPARTAAFS